MITSSACSHNASGVIVSAPFAVFFELLQARQTKWQSSTIRKAQERKELGTIIHAGRLINGQAASGHSEKVIKKRLNHPLEAACGRLKKSGFQTHSS